MSRVFPRTTVGGVSMPRLIMGTNWLLGYSHTSSAADEMIRARNCNREAIAEIAGVFLDHGIDAVMGLTSTDGPLPDGLKLAEDRAGKGFIRIDTPIINVSDSDSSRREAEAAIRQSKKSGSIFCLPHHSSAEQLVNKNLQAMPRLPDYLKMIRENGMIPGLSAHMPELVIYSDKNNYDVETYIQIYNCMGFLMQIEIEFVHWVIRNAKKPVMTIKPMAAGRCSPFVGLSFAFATLRECDMVTVGCLTPKEAAEDIEISLAAIERRFPEIGGRSSPKKTEIMK